MPETERKEVILSGIQPTGVFTLGNYLGAIKNWARLQDEFECAYMIADLHAITVRQEPAELRKRTLDAFALLLAAGIDPKKSLTFIQSHVDLHAKLSWVLSCFTQFGEMSRMTQFKDKSQKHPDNINVGLFTYPVLMAADILLYQADFVPVGADQKQHLEVARDIAARFNGLYGSVFTIPEPYIPKTGARVMSLQDPTKKMSKSDTNPNGYITILDTKEQIINKCKRAVTDSGREIVYREGKDGVNNLLNIYSSITGKPIPECEKEFEGKGYGEFKVAVGETIADELQPIRDNFARLRADTAYLKECYSAGAETAYRAGRRTVEKAYKKVGFLLP